MKTRGTALNLLISGVCISLIAIFLSGCSGSGGGGGGGSGNLYGTVINLSYSPVSNADVNVDSSSAKTLSNGTYSFINLSAGEKLIKITSTAHTSSYRRVTFSGVKARMPEFRSWRTLTARSLRYLIPEEQQQTPTAA